MNFKIALLIALVTFNGCGGDDDKKDNDNSNTSTENNSVINNDNTNNDTTSNTNVDLGNYNFIYVYKNVNDTIANLWLSAYDNEEGFFTREGNFNCSSVSGLSRFDAGSTLVAGVQTNYYASGDFSQICYEIDYKNAPSGSGNKTIIFSWNPKN